MGRIGVAYRRKYGPHALAELAARQHGVVAKAQLRRLGLSDSAIDRAVRAGRLHRLQRGVYAVGHTAITRDARCLAAVMACGPGAALSHRAAAQRWLLIRGAQPIEVTAPRAREPKQGFILHRSRSLGPEDRTVLDAIPITTVARTIVDLADVLSEGRLADAIHQAEFHRILDLDAIEAALERVPGRASRNKLRRALAHDNPPPLTRNDAERLLFDLCEAIGLPRPLANASIDGYEVDLYWPEAALVVELDGAAAHRTRRAFHEDRRRDRVLAAKRIQVVRVTDRDLRDPEALGRELRDVYAART